VWKTQSPRTWNRRPLQLAGVIFLKPVFGRVSDRVGRIPLILAGLAALIAGYRAAFGLVAALPAAALLLSLYFAHKHGPFFTAPAARSGQ